MKILALILVLVGCGNINVPAQKTDTGTATDTGVDQGSRTHPQAAAPVAEPGAAVTESCQASASAKVIVNGAIISSSEPVPDVAFGGDAANWIDAMSKVPEGYHLPSRGELVTLADSGVFSEKTGAWWTSTEGGHESAWLYSPDSGFLGKHDKLLTAKILYVKGAKHE